MDKFTNLGVTIQVERSNFKEWLAQNGHDDTTTLVRYSAQDEVAYIDERASEDYASWAGTHERFCCSDAKTCCGVVLPNDANRCATVEKTLIDNMPESYRDKYIDLRIEMFSFLLEKRLYSNDSQAKRSFQNTLKMLKEVKKLNLGT